MGDHNVFGSLAIGFNGFAVLESDADLQFQVGNEVGQGVSVAGSNISADLKAANFDDIDVTSAEGVSDALGSLDSLLENLSSRVAKLGASQNRFESISYNLENSEISAAASRSRIIDTDVAKESANLVSNSIRQEASIAIQAQANKNSSFILGLLA